MPVNSNNRRFSYTEPVLYNGAYYPTAKVYMDNGNGVAKDSTMFVDNNGQYYTMDNDKAYPVDIQYELPEVEVTPSKEEDLSAAFDRYLTMSNDRTRVNNVPHREYNIHLKDNALKGAREHNLWDKEHPNLSAWRDFATAVPFGVASAPLVGGLGETTLGQAAINGVNKFMANPLIEIANSAIGMGFGANGLQDISRGTFTPNTAMELAGIPLGIKSELSAINKIRRNTSLRNAIKETPIPKDVKAEGAKRYTDFINSPEYSDRLIMAGLEKHWEEIKDLTNKRLNGKGNFPGRNQEIVYNNPQTLGLSSTYGSTLFNPHYGITLKSSLYPDRVMPTLDHEIAHWATKNAQPMDKGFLGDMMAYNESLTPNLSWESVLRRELRSNPSINDIKELEKWYKYLIDPQEKRARAMSIYQQAKDKGMTTDEFIDLYTDSNGNIYRFAPEQLRDMATIFTRENLKKYLNRFLGISIPIGIGASVKNNQTQKDYDRH